MIQNYKTRGTNITLEWRGKDGAWIEVAPVLFTEASVKKFPITEKDAENIVLWIFGEMMIQDALPHWTDDEREILLTGLDKTEWNSIFCDPDEVSY